MEGSENKNNTTKETIRLEAFSDGVFAIAITLLILEIHVPELKENETLSQSLMHEWPSFLAFIIGFFTILICWINHHFMFRMIHKSNDALSLINGFKLLVVTVTPFSTALLSKHIQTTWSHSAINIYAFNFALMGLAMTAIWYYSYAKKFAVAKSNHVLKATTHLYFFAGIFSILIWIVSYFSVVACLALSVAMFFIFVFPERVVAWLVGRNK